jgi:hypothetical protein
VEEENAILSGTFSWDGEERLLILGVMDLRSERSRVSRTVEQRDVGRSGRGVLVFRELECCDRCLLMWTVSGSAMGSMLSDWPENSSRSTFDALPALVWLFSPSDENMCIDWSERKEKQRGKLNRGIYANTAERLARMRTRSERPMLRSMLPFFQGWSMML